MTRVLTAAVLIAVVLFGIFDGSGWVLLAVIGVISSLTYIEYCQLLEIRGVSRMLGLSAGLGLLIIPLSHVFLWLLLFSLIAFVLPLGAPDLRDSFERSAAMLVGVVYVFGAFKTAYLLGLRSPWWLLLALGIDWIGDSGAYYIGRKFGKTKLAPRVSPGKSWEGAIASAVLSTLLFGLLAPRLLPVAWPVAALLAITGNIAGQGGDLAESALKRAVGVKDSGALLPGHGGMLDRVDSVLFTLPVVYALVIGLHL